MSLPQLGSSSRRAARWSILGFFLGALLSGLAGAAPQESTTPPPPSIAELEARLASLEGLGDEASQGEAALYAEALQALRSAAEHRARARQFAADAAQAKLQLEALRQAEQGAPAGPLTLPPSSSLTEAERALEAAQAEATTSQAQVLELDRLRESRQARRALLPSELAAGQQSLTAARQALAALPPQDSETPRGVLLAARAEAAAALAEALENERLNDVARQELLPLRRDDALRRQRRAEEAVSRWRERVEALRTAQGENASARAQEQLEEVVRRFPALEALARRNQELAALRSGSENLPRRISAAQAALAETRSQVTDLNRLASVAQRRVNAAGLTESVGLFLRRDYEALPRRSELARARDQLESALSKALIELISYQEERLRLGDLSSARARTLDLLELEDPSEDLLAATQGLLAAQREALDAVLADYGELTAIYQDHEAEAAALQEMTSRYRSYIRERILWVRSVPANPVGALGAVPAHLGALWSALVQSVPRAELGTVAARRPFWLFFVVVGFSLPLIGRRFLKRKRNEMAGLVRTYKTDAYLYTFRALVQSLLLALPGPVALHAVGTLAAQLEDPLLAAAGSTMESLAPWFLVFRFAREVLAENGLALAHFRWPESSVRHTRRQLRWLEPVLLTCLLVARWLRAQETGAWSDSIGRLAFVVSMLSLGLVCHRLLHGQSPLWSTTSVAKSLAQRTQRAWTLALSLAPLALALAATLGYYYTAVEFALRLELSLAVALGLVLVRALLLRWLFIARRKLAVHQALEAKARREEEEQQEIASTESGTASLDADKVDIPAVDAQTRQLFTSSLTLATAVGLYFIWAGVLPALQGLDRLQLWPELAVVTIPDEALSLDSVGPYEVEARSAHPGSPPTLPGASAESTEGSPASPVIPLPPPEAEPSSQGLPTNLTVADLLLATVFVLLTTIAAKNLPALLELTLLRRLPLDGGARYAVSTIVRYLIVLIGISAVSSAVGIGWGQVQWLAAALTFGLAFGLQEIFANFVSGIIILIERPIRVGDIVTVGQTEGRVTQLRMRATTITDWDRRELLIPNKEFITGSVVNWTLSDPITRLTIPVGVAYGSDTAKARRLLLEIARSTDLVLQDPAPSAIFVSFGESSLDFKLRVFMPNRDYWPQLIDHLHLRIDEAFREAGIEIAFPQRDIHIRSNVDTRG